MLMAQGIPGFRESTDPADLDTQQRIMKIFVSVHTPLTPQPLRCHCMYEPLDDSDSRESGPYGIVA